MTLNFSIRKGDLFIPLWVGVAAILSQAIDSFLMDALFSLIIFAGIVWIANKNSSVHVMCLIGYSTFIFFPALMNGYFFETKFNLLYATSLITFYFLKKTNKTDYVSPPENKNLYFVLFSIYSLLVIIFSIELNGDLTHYVLSPCVMFYALCLRNNKIYYNISVFLIFVIVFTIYLVFGWGGYGRTVAFGNLIVAILYFIYANKLPNSKLLFSIAPALSSALLVTRKEVNLKNIDVYEFLNDSAVGPYRLADTFIENYNSKGFDISGFVEQVVFSLTSFVPRELWPSKPYGFGFEYVVRNMDQYLIDSGHSIASTLIGDHIYYLGWLGVVTGFFMAFFVAKLVNIFYNFKILNSYAIVIISCNMMVLMWGGMTSFSARVIYPLIGLFPLWAMYMIFRKILKPALKI